MPSPQTSREKAKAMLSSVLTAALVFLTGLLGFIWRGYSKAKSRSEALAVVIRQRVKAEQAHTTKHRELDDVETRNDSLDLDTLGDTIDAVFSDMSDDAGEGR